MGHTWSPEFVILAKLRCACLLPLWSPQFGMGLVHLVLCLVERCWLCVPLEWGDRLSTPQVQRLLHHEPRLLRRKRDCTPALFLTSSVCTSTLSPCSSEEEGLAPLPSSSRCRGGLRRIGPPPHTAGKFLRGAVVTQMGRSGDTMICEKATFCTRVQVGTARDAL